MAEPQNQVKNRHGSIEQAHFPTETDSEPKIDVVPLGMPWIDINLRFDPQIWDITTFREDVPDPRSLTHQSLPGGCIITPNPSAGLGGDWPIEEDRFSLGKLELDIKIIFEDGVLVFKAYFGFTKPNQEGVVEVHFENHVDECTQAAEDLFAVAEVILL